MTSTTTEARVGTTLDGKYRLDRILGIGGMGVVYEGYHLRLERPVAVKFLHPQFSQHPEVVRRFMREAQSTARLQHANVVDVRDIDCAPDGSVYMVLELLTGESLARRLARAPRLTVAETLAIALPLMDALATAHEHGIVHRDLKPDNLFLSRSVSRAIVPKVLDFGVAKLAHEAGPSATSTGTVIGTPAYMSPEQALGKRDVGPAADVWSMGMVLYECLTGRLPFDFAADANSTEVIVTVVSNDVIPVSRVRGDLGAELAAAIDRALVKDPQGRFQTMRGFIAALADAAARAQQAQPTAAHVAAPDAAARHDAWASKAGAGPSALVSRSPTPFVSASNVAALEANLGDARPARRLATLGGIAAAVLVAAVLGLSGAVGPDEVDASTVASAGRPAADEPRVIDEARPAAAPAEVAGVGMDVPAGVGMDVPAGVGMDVPAGVGMDVPAGAASTAVPTVSLTARAEPTRAGGPSTDASRDRPSSARRAGRANRATGEHTSSTLGLTPPPAPAAASTEPHTAERDPVGSSDHGRAGTGSAERVAAHRADLVIRPGDFLP